jgi:uncharacterized membrane protein (UPF0127 family)
MLAKLRWIALAALVLPAACGKQGASLEDLNATTITLPDGVKIKAETMREQVDLARGMMFRDALRPNRGMLFVHPRPGKYSYWMYQTKVPLDIIWMDPDGRIVEIVSDVPPCTTAASQCATYGGNQVAQYVLELNAGQAAAYGLKVGDRLDF